MGILETGSKVEEILGYGNYLDLRWFQEQTWGFLNQEIAMKIQHMGILQYLFCFEWSPPWNKYE